MEASQTKFGTRRCAGTCPTKEPDQCVGVRYLWRRVAVATLVTGLPAKLSRRNPRVAGKAVHAACLPIAGVAGIDEDDAMQITPKPERCRQPCGSAADYSYVIGIAHIGR